MDKLGRNYSLSIQINDAQDFLEVKPPLTIEFDIQRHTLSSANVCEIKVYNLSPKNRNLIRYNCSNYGQYRSIELKAGYGDNIATIFAGNISQAWSTREGVNVITQIQCYDAGFAFANAQSNRTFKIGTPFVTVLRDLISDLPNVTLGAIGNFPGILTRGNTYGGSTVEILTKLSGGAFFIDKGKAYILGTNEYAFNINTGGIINYKSGLLGSPILEDTIVRFDMIFEPQLNVGGMIFLDSIVESAFNGNYKVTAVSHKGMISEAICGDAITTGEFFYSKELQAVHT